MFARRLHIQCSAHTSSNPNLKTIMKRTNYLLVLLLLLGSAISASAQTPVQTNGRLSVKGARLCNQNGYPIQLKGMSSFGLQWSEECLTKQSLSVLVNDWHSDVFRIAMYVEEGGYNTDTAAFITRVDSVVRWSIELGIYVIIDWHILTPGDPLSPKYAGAMDFFSLMAKRYGNRPNVIFELCNEPNGDAATWARIKKYALPIIAEIRKYSENIILVGTPNWSQMISDVSKDPISATNIMYAFHFYSATHYFLEQYLADNVNSLPIFVSEWGVTESSGTGTVDTIAADRWLDVLERNKVSWCAWQLSDSPQKTSVFQPGSCAAANWANLTEEGAYLRRKIQLPHAYVPQVVPPSITKGFAARDSIWLNTDANVTVSGLFNETHFTVTVNNRPVTVTGAVSGGSSQIALKLLHPVLPTDTLLVSYDGHASIYDAGGTPLRACDHLYVPNEGDVVATTGFFTDFNPLEATLPVEYSEGFVPNVDNDTLHLTGASSIGPSYSIFRIPLADLTASPKVTLSVRTAKAHTMNVELGSNQNSFTNTFSRVTHLIGDNLSHEYVFDFSGQFASQSVDSTKIVYMALIFDLELSAPFSGDVYIDKVIVGDSIPSVKQISINEHLVNTPAEKAVQLTATLTPAIARPSVRWYSLDPTLATVSQDGLVHTLRQGTVNIVVQSCQSPAVADTCTFVVDNQGALLTGILTGELTRADALAADAKPGLQQDMYSAEAIAQFSADIAQARAALASATQQAEIDASAATLHTASQQFYAQHVVIDQSALNAAWFQTQYRLQQSQGNLPGQYPASSFAALSQVCDDVLKSVNPHITQHTADSLTQVLLAAVDAFAKTQIPRSADYHQLDSLLILAQSVKDTLTIGTAPGTYSPQVAADFDAEYCLALQTDYRYTSSQTEIDAAVNQLKNAISTIKQSQNVSSDGQPLASAEQLVAYPSPFARELTVQTSITGTKTVTLVNSQGAAVRSLTFSEAQVSISAPELPAGLYQIIITATDGQRATVTITKAK